MRIYNETDREINDYVKSQPIKTQMLFSYMCCLNDENLTKSEYRIRITSYVGKLKSINL